MASLEPVRIDRRQPSFAKLFESADVIETSVRHYDCGWSDFGPKRSSAAPVIRPVVPITPASIRTHSRSPAPALPKKTTLTMPSRRRHWTHQQSALVSCCVALVGATVRIERYLLGHFPASFRCLRGAEPLPDEIGSEGMGWARGNLPLSALRSLLSGQSDRSEQKFADSNK